MCADYSADSDVQVIPAPKPMRLRRDESAAVTRQVAATSRHESNGLDPPELPVGDPGGLDRHPVRSAIRWSDPGGRASMVGMVRDRV
jgi:hypothetical protein